MRRQCYYLQAATELSDGRSGGFTIWIWRERENQKLEGRPIKTIVTWLSLLIVLVASDQILKLIMISWLGPDATYHRWELAGRYLAFQYIENRGAAFGILEGQTGLLIILALVVAVGFVFTLRREIARNEQLQLALVLIAAGALGNLADRIRLGYVVDYIAIGSWPKFNIADICITLAVALLAWTSLTNNPTSTSESKEPLRD